MRDVLSGIQDIARIVSRASSGVAGPRDLIALARSLDRLKELQALLAPVECAMLKSLGAACAFPDDVQTSIDAALNPEPPPHLRDGGVIRAGFSAELDELRDAAKGGKAWIAQIETRERERTGIKSLKVGYNSVFGYYLEVSKAASEAVPADYIRKQTTRTERYITPELKEHESRVLGATERAVLWSRSFSRRFGAKSRPARRSFWRWHGVAEVDCLASLPRPRTPRAGCPEVDDSDEILIQAGGIRCGAVARGGGVHPERRGSELAR